MIIIKTSGVRKVLLLFLIGVLGLQVSAQIGEKIFDDTVLHKIEFFNVDISAIRDPALKSVYQQVDIKIDGNILKMIGLATKGEKSYLAAPNDKKPFKIKTDKFIEGQKYDGIKRFNLHNNLYDKGFMREKLTCDASARMGIHAPKCAFAEVYTNGEYWGVYTLVEAQDEIYKRTFGDNNGFTIESFGSPANLNNLAYYGKNPEDYSGQYIVDHGDENLAWQQWITLLDKIQNLPPRYGYVDSISKYIDYQTYFKFNAVLDYNLNAEPKNRNGIYYYDIDKKKWFTICWDQNVAFADFIQPDQNNFPNMQMTAFLDKYATYSQFSEAYDQTLCQLSNSIFTENEVDSKIEAYRKIIDDAVEKDIRKGFTFKEYELSIVALREFIAIRNNETSEFLKKKGCICTTTVKQPELENTGIRVFPNPAKDFLYVRVPETAVYRYSISNMQGNMLQKGLLTNTNIPISSLPAGVFLLEIYHAGQRVAAEKLIKI